MRIISGLLKGKKINFLSNSITRPLKDSVRENIFNILKHSKIINLRVENSNVLDLYSGVGSFGIECLSRGAKKVIFVEKDIQASNMLINNLNHLSILNKAKIINNKIENILETLNDIKFQIFFLDPPFADEQFLNNLQILKKRKNYEKEHIVIIHRERKSKDDLKGFLNIVEIKEYGRSKIIFGCFN